MPSCRLIEFVNCDDPDRSRCDVDFMDLDRSIQDELMELQLAANGTNDRAHTRLRRQYTERKDRALQDLRELRARCAGRADQQKGTVMNPELLEAAKQLNVRTDGLDERGLALAILAACGTNVNGPRNDADATAIVSQSDAYVIARAGYAAKGRADAQARRDESRAFATVQLGARTDCGCTKTDRADAVGRERASRDAMLRRNRVAYAEGTEQEDSVEAIENIREGKPARPTARPVMGTPNPMLAIANEQAARAAMMQASRNAYKEPTTTESDEGEV